MEQVPAIMGNCSFVNKTFRTDEANKEVNERNLEQRSEYLKMILVERFFSPRLENG
jgi:hypothetical protein